MKKLYITIVVILIIIISVVFTIVKSNGTSGDKKLPITSLKTEFTHSFENYLSASNSKAYFFKVQVPDNYNNYIINNETRDDSIMSYNTKRENGKTTAYTVGDEDKSVVIEYTLYNDFEKLNKEYIKDNKFEEVIGYSNKFSNLKQEKTFYVCTINSNTGREYKAYYENINGFYITIDIVSNNCILDDTYKELLVSYDIEEDNLENYMAKPRDGYYNFNFNSGFSDEGAGKSVKLSLDYRVNEGYEIVADIFSYRSSTNAISNINKDKNIEKLTDTLVYTYGSPYNLTSEDATVNIQIGGGTKDASQRFFNSEYKYADNQEIPLIEKTEEKELVLKNGNTVKYYKRIYGNENNRYEYIYAYTMFSDFIDFVFMLSGQKNEVYTEDILQNFLEFNGTVTDYMKSSR